MSMNARSFAGTTMSASGVLEEEHVPAALELGEVGEERHADGAGRAARPCVTTLRHRSGCVHRGAVGAPAHPSRGR